MKDFRRTPKFVMYYLFPVDSILRDEKATPESVDRSNLCLPEDDEVTGRMLHLFHPIPAAEIVADLREMGLNGLACVGLDGTCLTPQEIRSERYAELIRQCREAGLFFVHGFPFADAYDNSLAKKYPWIRQRTYQGEFPHVGWSEVNGHPNIDYGSEEFIDFCREAIDALKQLGVTVIDYAEPDHYPCVDNGYGESLEQAWREATGQAPPYPPDLAYRRFMEDRNLKGIKAIGEYAKSLGMNDHLTASPLMHGGILVGQNFGKYSRTDIDELSTTYHTHAGYTTVSMARNQFDMSIPVSRADSLGCLESKSMRGWAERHAVYAGCGQGLPLEKLKEMLETAVLLHQMDLFFWEYGNFRNASMYSDPGFENPQAKYRQFKKLVRSTVDTYFSLPEDYRSAVADPDALVFYSKETDYIRAFSGREHDKLSGQCSLYATALKLQSSGIPSMLAYDEYPEVLARDGKDVPLLIIDGYQHLNADFAEAIDPWFSSGKAVLFGGELAGRSKELLECLSARIPDSPDPDSPKPYQMTLFRNSDYTKACDSLTNPDGWFKFLTLDGKPIVYMKGNADSGLLVYSVIPYSRLYQIDLQNICRNALGLIGRQPEVFAGAMEREIVRYRRGARQYLSIKNHGSATESLLITTRKKPTAYYPRGNEASLTGQAGEYKLKLNFRPHEVRIIEYP